MKTKYEKIQAFRGNYTKQIIILLYKIYRKMRKVLIGITELSVYWKISSQEESLHHYQYI